jgi:hypothetical protein
MLYNMYIFSRSGKCLWYKEWSRPQNTLPDDPDEERKLVYGMLFSLKDLAAKLSPSTSSDGSSGTSGEGLHLLKTNAFTLHHFQAPTGLVFVLNTDNEVPDQFNTLKHIYTNIFIEYVSRSPLYHRADPDEPISLPVFDAKVEEVLLSRAK